MTTRISEVKLTSHSSIDELVEGVAKGTTTASGSGAVVLQPHRRRGRDDSRFLSLDREGALARARKIDAKAAAGEALPALAGVPMGIKDVLVVDGQPATAGSKILEGYRPPYTATAVQQVDRRGRGAAGQAELRRVRDGLVERELGVWAGAESA